MTLRGGGGGGSRLSVIMTLTVGNMICESPLTASGARKNKLSLQRHSSAPVLSFDTEVEELNIAIDQGRHNDDSSISTKFVFHNKRQSLVPEALPTSNNITPSLHKLPLLL